VRSLIGRAYAFPIPTSLTRVSLVVGVFFLSWQTVTLQPSLGLDYSWTAGLAMAAHSGISFGNHLVFTLGPLGFISTNPIWYADSGELAFLYLIALRIGLAAAVYAAARRSYGAFWGFVITILVATVIEANGLTSVVSIVWLIAATLIIERPPGVRASTAVAAAGGGLAAFELLIKVSVGGELSAMVAVLALTMAGSWRRYIAASVSAFIVVLLLGWMVSGQSIGVLPDYIHNAARIVSGYSSAMVDDQSAIRWQYPVALIAFLLGLAGALYTTRNATSRQRIGVAGLWVVFAFFEFKEAFQRHDAAHGATYFTALLGAVVAYRFLRGNRMIGLGMLGVMLAFAVSAQNQTWSSMIDPFGDAETAFTQIKQVFDTSERNRTIAAGRAVITSAIPLDAKTLALLHDKTVAVAPFEAVLAWAYHLSWTPLPVFQSYATYTTGLDQLNANAAASAEAPERILLLAGADIDGRIPQFDEPLTERTILCRYQELHTAMWWDVLARGPNRCGPPVAMSTVKAAWGQEVPVPSPPNEHTLITVRIGGVQVGGLERLRAFLYKARERFILIGGVAHRLVPGTAGDGLVLRAPAGADFSPPFSVAPNVASIAVKLEGSQPSGQPITYSFYAVPVEVGPRYAPLQKEIIGGATK
jgi:hypothetical protein